MTAITRRGVLVAMVGLATPSVATERLRMAVTTTFENSGLAAHLLPQLEAATGIAVQPIVVGTGQAHTLARQGDIDLLVTHAPEQEAALVASGAVVDHRPLMVNDFILVGPRDDPAGVAGLTDVAKASQRIADTGAPFISRGDRSGTHVRERALWSAAGIDPDALSGWYREAGAGMGAALNMAAGLGAYVLTDRGTWLAFRNRGPLTILVVGDPPVENPYAIMIVNPDRHPHVPVAAARRAVDWLTGPSGQAAIGSFAIDGAPAFYPVLDSEDPS